MVKKQQQIIIADDENSIRLLFSQILQNAGYTVFLAQDGNEVLELVKDNAIDIIVLDILMPGLDGFETLQCLKKDEKTKEIPVIFITGSDDAETLKKGYEYGIADYISKPANQEEIRARIKTQLEIKTNRETIGEYVSQLQETINEMSALFETGTLVAGVVHDTKKFTTSMAMMLESIVIPKLTDELDGSQDWVKEILDDLSEVHSNSMQCTEFLESLLAINRKSEALEPVDINHIIHQAINLVSYTMIQEGVQWEIEECSDVAMITGNSQLIRVFMNIMVNAVDALKKTETPDPTIKIKIEEMDNEFIISITDNGPGIKKEVLEGIRKGMILSTKGKGGNGFGVSGLTKIVKSLNGKIEIESEIGKGATFIVTLAKTDVMASNHL